ncbi:hypothetical protein [Kitasatospora sp. SUK 42]|uniref:hypothetical protein n=1 Tax=Kitasatospora sp. SUK 42 TaxID=1588882 RepID=UPI0018C94273|nr:hypothetical protein [Kitasatospora sp. SUK 42]MBV2156665.1 hypothetical protein [Kitasatospora sp. SUK 42]
MTAAVRVDLLALDADTLAALANRGLVKRAAREVAAGDGPVPSLDPDGTLRGTCPDGSVVALPPGTGLDGGSCTCAAPGVCRHRIALVLAHQRAAADDTPAPPDPGPGPAAPDTPAPAPGWSPGALDDEALTAAVGARAVAAARRTLERGYTARLHHARPDDPQPVAELAACTVRFPVPGELGFAVTDAAQDRRGEMIALAVWAFRAADGRPTVTLGGRSAPDPGIPPVLDAALDLARELLLDGSVHAGPVLTADLHRVRGELADRSLHWPAGVVAELVGQLDAYAARSADHRPEELALLLAELHARHRAAAHPGTSRPEVLGVREAAETPLRRVRLTALGCRIRGTATTRSAELLLAHPAAGTVLVLRRSWDVPADGRPPTGHQLAARRVAGHRLDALATGNVVSESAVRSAARELGLGRGRIAGTTVTPVGGAWTDLPAPLLLTDLDAHLRTLEGRPPRLIRPRIAAESLHVVRLSAVEEVRYDAAEQRLEAAVRDAAGNPATLAATYDPACPGALDAVAAALGTGTVTHVSATVRRAAGRTVLEPVALLAGGTVVVPDLAPGAGSAALGPAAPPSADPVTAGLAEALAALADTAHRGLRHADGPVLSRLDGTAARLNRCGLATTAELLRALADAIRAGDPDAAARTWSDSAIRVAVTIEAHRETAGRP